jgi:IS30 family transposase
MGATVHIKKDEMILIEKMCKENASYIQISSHLQRSIAGVKNHILANGGRSCYTAENAYKRYQENKQRQHDCLFKNKYFSEKIRENLRHDLEMGVSQDECARKYKLSRFSIKKFMRENNLSLSINERISSIEMQLSIITNQLRKLNVKN